MNTVEWWLLIVGGGGVAGIGGVLLRISYQMGAFVTEFRAYVRLNDLVVDKIDKRLSAVERRRR
ncbi:MAG TPA: hypothetical protein VNO54_06575 [Streptosporangiaceae bacterium]|nr:hypothetical protein [Streptosporangiaceae bacterium]